MDETTNEPHASGIEGTTPSDQPSGAMHGAAAVITLKQAMRRASVDGAERAGVVSNLRAARLGRLEMLQEALQPLAAQIPHDIDLFDLGVLPGLEPRLFIDVIGFVEMGRDTRLYRFFEDTRHGRTLIVESAKIDRLVDAITDYVARRLLERERALAAAVDGDGPATRQTLVRVDRARDVAPRPPAPRRTALRWASAAFWFLIHLLGSITFFVLLAFAGWLIWNGMHKPE